MLQTIKVSTVTSSVSTSGFRKAPFKTMSRNADTSVTQYFMQSGLVYIVIFIPTTQNDVMSKNIQGFNFDVIYKHSVLKAVLILMSRISNTNVTQYPLPCITKLAGFCRLGSSSDHEMRP